MPRPLEITDVIGAGALPRARDAAVADLRARGQRRAARIVASLPTEQGRLTARSVAPRLASVYRELQRLEEELQVPRMVAQELAPMVAALKPGPGNARVRILDVGCGLGYIPRWMASRQPFGPYVDIVGADHDAGLIAQARALAQAESLPCSFEVADAFDLAADSRGPRTIVMSTWLLHHLDEETLAPFLTRHAEVRVPAFAHWDLAPNVWTTLGGWIYHRARARDAITRHDGVLSGLRAYPAESLMQAAAVVAPDYDVTCADGHRWVPRPLRVLRPIVGLRRPEAGA